MNIPDFTELEQNTYLEISDDLIIDYGTFYFRCGVKPEVLETLKLKLPLKAVPMLDSIKGRRFIWYKLK